MSGRPGRVSRLGSAWNVVLGDESQSSNPTCEAREVELCSVRVGNMVLVMEFGREGDAMKTLFPRAAELDV